VYRYALRKRCKRYSVFAVIIQKYVRRYFVLNHLETLILALIKRKNENKKKIDILDLDGSSTSPEALRPTPPPPPPPLPARPPPPAPAPAPATVSQITEAESRNGNSLKDLKSTHLFQKQISADSRSNSGMLKLFKQVSGKSDDAETGTTTHPSMAITPQISSSTSSKGLLGGLIPSPASSLSQRSLMRGSSLSQRNLIEPSLSHRSLFGENLNPKTLYPKRSFSRAYSDVLARQEAGNDVMSRLLEHGGDGEDGEEEEGGRSNKTHSLGSDLSDNQVYLPAVNSRTESPCGRDRLKSPIPRLNETKPSKSSSLSDSEDIPIALSKSSNGFPVEDPNRLSIESTSTVKTSDTVKKDDPKRKPPLPESRSSFSLSNFSLRPFARIDNKSPTPVRPNLSTITEGLILSLSISLSL
jgi:hypothetical protein